MSAESNDLPTAVLLDHSTTPLGAVDIDPDDLPPIGLARSRSARRPPPSPNSASTTVSSAPSTEDTIVRTFAIQELTLPIALLGHDLIGQARTGMGKTLGFGVPLLQRLLHEDAAHTAERAPRALVIVPTRELCVQVARDLTRAASRTDLVVTSVYGGRAYEPQVAALRAGVDVVVGTPGRLLDLAKNGSLILGAVHVLVLDEADEMLDLGFLPDIEKVLAMVPATKQTMLFSATMPGPIITLARSFMSRPTHIRAEAPAEGATHLTTRQFVYRAHAMDKVELVARALQATDRGLTMIFTRTKRTAQKVADDLTERGFAAAAVHGDLGQAAREQALRAFRSGKVDVLVATDVAARGIDVEDVTHVINFQCPDDEKTYMHRIGRTGRAGRTGTAITLVDWDDMARWKMINDALGLATPEPAETYSNSPHLFADLGIPEERTGRLPRRSAPAPGWRPRSSRTSVRPADVGARRPPGTTAGPAATAARARRWFSGQWLPRCGPGAVAPRAVALRTVLEASRDSASQNSGPEQWPTGTPRPASGSPPPAAPTRPARPPASAIAAGAALAAAPVRPRAAHRPRPASEARHPDPQEPFRRHRGGP